MDEAIFERPVRIEAGARRVTLGRAAFHSGGHVFVRWAEVSAEEVDFAAPSLLAALPLTTETYPDIRDSLEPGPRIGFIPPNRPWERADLVAAERALRQGRPFVVAPPQVVSVRWAQLAQLTLSGVDLRRCRFAGAYGLDNVRLERTELAQSPPRRRWTRRQTIAEEHHWRSQHHRAKGWYEEYLRPPGWLTQASDAPSAEQIVGIYRALRKGREDSKDEPGAADFYYGEMEMRRQSPREADGRPVSMPERVTLWLYWLVSGYGLRASRALIALAITIALFGAVPLDLWGFRHDRSYGRALLFAAESSISLLRAPAAELRAGGEVIQILLRLAGPLFFGLALLSLRSRIKR